MSPNNLLHYTNGVGHLIMSVVGMIVGLMLILFSNDASTKGIGIALIVTIQGVWFIPGSARMVAYEVQKQIKTTTQPLPIEPAQQKPPTTP